MTIQPERTLHLGDTDDVWGKVTDPDGADLTGVGLTLRVIAPETAPTAWTNADQEDRTVVGVIRARRRYTPTVTGRHTLQAKLTPPGRVVILTLGEFNVISP